MTPAGTTDIRAAVESDPARVGELLQAAKLPLDGLPAPFDGFLVAERDGVVVGAIGRERYGVDALLRSLVVGDGERGTGVGRRLAEALVDAERRDGARTVYLLTTTAERWFPRFGFVRITRDDVPAAVKMSAEFRGACPDTAVVMRLRLG